MEQTRPVQGGYSGVGAYTLTRLYLSQELCARLLTRRLSQHTRHYRQQIACPAARGLVCEEQRGEGGYLVKLPWAARRGNRRGRADHAQELRGSCEGGGRGCAPGRKEERMMQEQRQIERSCSCWLKEREWGKEGGDLVGGAFTEGEAAVVRGSPSKDPRPFRLILTWRTRRVLPRDGRGGGGVDCSGLR